MNNQPIFLVAGEPNSIFLEIFFKSLKKVKFKSPLILIVSKKLLIKQMEKLGFNYKINLISKNSKNFKILDNKKINLINIDYNFKKPFDKISKKSHDYIEKSFAIALEILKKNKFSKFINGPISKKYFLNQKYLGITEYLSFKTGRSAKVAMLIYNKKLSVSPITTHLPVKAIHKNLSKKKRINNVAMLIFNKKLT